MKAVAKKKINEFRSAFQAGIEGIVKASEIYVDAIDADPSAADEFRREFEDWIPSSAWAQFEAVGRKWMHPKLLMGGMANRKKASKIKHLPYSVQERVFARDRFPLLVSCGDTINVDMLEATEEQVDQLCNKTSIRNLSEQKAWMEAKQVLEDQKPEIMPYTICGGKVSFRRSITLTRQELKRLLQEM